MVNDRPTVYNTSSVYKEAGGGGGGEIIPDGFSRLYYIEYKAASSIGFDFTNVNDLSSNDKYFLTAYIPATAPFGGKIIPLQVRSFNGSGNEFVDAKITVISATNANVFAIRALFHGENISMTPGNFSLEFSVEGEVKINGITTNLENGSFSNNGKLLHLMDVDYYNNPETMDGTKFFNCLITSSNDIMKHNFIPIVDNITNIAYVLDTKTGIMKNSSNWIPGPIML